MAQTTYTSKYETSRGNKNVVRIFGKSNFATADFTASISAQINEFLYGKLTPIKATTGSTAVQDELYFGTASVTASNTIVVGRGKSGGTSGMSFFFEVIGR